MQEKFLFKGGLTELIAPMCKNEEIDYGMFREQIQFQLENGIRGLFLSGLTECMVTSLDEQIEMLKFTVKEVGGKVPVMGSICTNRPQDALRMLEAYTEYGADAVALAQPHTFTYGEEAMYNYYTELIRASKIPFYIYNAPQTNNSLSPELVCRLIRENENVRGYKDSLIDIMHLQQVMGGVDPERHLEVLGGSDASTYALMAMGGCGVISWVSVIFPKLIIEMCDAYLAGEIEKARRLMFKVNEVRSALRQAPMDTGYRTVGAIVGCPLGYARRPMTPEATPEQKEKVISRLKEIGML